MPSALAFIGGGLLQGLGEGIAKQGIETGKDKRKRALADLKHMRDLERDKTKLEGQQGLLTQRLDVENARFGRPVEAAGPGGPALIQTTPGGGVREVEGFTPPPSESGNITQTQRSSNDHTDQARAFWREKLAKDYGGDGKAMLEGIFQLNSFTNFLEPRDKAMADLWTAARKRKVGPDPDFEPFMRQFAFETPVPDTAPEPPQGRGLLGGAQDFFNNLFDDDAAEGGATPPPPVAPGVVTPLPAPGAASAAQDFSTMSQLELADLLNGPAAAKLTQQQLDAIGERLKALGR